MTAEDDSLDVFCRYCGCQFASAAEARECYCGRDATFDKPYAMLQKRREWVGRDDGPIYPEPATEHYLEA